MTKLHLEGNLISVATVCAADSLPAEKVAALADTPAEGDLLHWVTQVREAANGRARESAGQQSNGSQLILIPMSEVEPEEVSWLWAGRIPRGKLTLLEGDPGLGKSWLTLAIATAVATGSPLPGDSERRTPAKVLLLTHEDGLGDTIRPRLDALGVDVSDLSKVVVVKAVRGEDGRERLPSLIEDLGLIETHLAAGGFDLAVIDPINNYLGSALDTHRDAAIRSVLTPLAALAERCGVAVLCVRHLTKGARDKAIYRGQGSIGYTGVARVVLLVGQEPDAPERRVVIAIKTNLTAMAPGIAFELKDGRFLWAGESTATPEALVAPGSDSDAKDDLEEAKEFLREELSIGARPSLEIYRLANKHRIAERTLWRARRALRVVRFRRGESGRRGGGEWFLQMPTEPEEPVERGAPEIKAATGSLNGGIKAAKIAKEENLAALIGSEYESPSELGSLNRVGSLNGGAEGIKAASGSLNRLLLAEPLLEGPRHSENGDRGTRAGATNSPAGWPGVVEHQDVLSHLRARAAHEQYAHRGQSVEWWQRDGISICGVCHPNPTTNS